MRIPETSFPGHPWRRHSAGDLVAGHDHLPLNCWICRYCKEPVYTEYPYLKPDPDECPRPRECGPVCTLPTAEYPQPALHADLDDVALEDVIYWCEAAYVGRRRGAGGRRLGKGRPAAAGPAGDQLPRAAALRRRLAHHADPGRAGGHRRFSQP